MGSNVTKNSYLPHEFQYKSKTMTDIVFVDDVYSGEDSDLHLSANQSEIKEREDDAGEEGIDQEENKEESWVVGSREPTILDRGLNVDLSDKPSFIDYFYLCFHENQPNQPTETANQINLPKKQLPLCKNGIVCHQTCISELGRRMA